MRIASEAELDRYMEGSAATVGLIMAPLLGAPPEAPRATSRASASPSSSRTSSATSRDDWRLDRVYLRPRPRTRWPADGDAAVRERVAHHVGRARALFAETAPATDA